MKKARFSLILFALCTILSCEKLDTSIPNQGTETTEAKSDDSNSTYKVSDLFSSEFQESLIENGGTLTDVWLSGYIVGYISGTTISSAKFNTGDKRSNILLADSPFETDPANCVPVQLSTSPAAANTVRNALNLNDHPDNLGKKVKVFGDIVKGYMSTIGMKGTTKYLFLADDFDYESYYAEQNEQDDETEDEQEEDNKDDNTEDKPGSDEDADDSILEVDVYSVADLLGPLTDYYRAHGVASISNCLVKGYIVGYVRKNKSTISQTSFELTFPVESNIVLADNPNETDYQNCIAVQLTTGSTYIATREALNLKEHPENHHRCVTVLGSIQKYMGVLGVKNTRDYFWAEE